MMRPEPVLRRLEWAFPPPPVERELVSLAPEEPADRPPILFVHGAWHGAWCWREHWMPEAAARGWSTHAVDLRGHGRSRGRERLRTTPLRHFVHDVLQAITELPEPPVLVGHSMGGLVVQHVLERYPARAGVLVAPAPPDHGLDLLARHLVRRPGLVLDAMLGREVDVPPELLVSDAVDRATAQAYAARLQRESAVAVQQLVLPRRPRPSKAPVLVIGGGDDRLLPAHAVVRTARRYGTRAHLFRGMGHDLMLEARWDAPLALLLGWLERLPGVVSPRRPPPGSRRS